MSVKRDAAAKASRGPANGREAANACSVSRGLVPPHGALAGGASGYGPALAPPRAPKVGFNSASGAR